MQHSFFTEPGVWKASGVHLDDLGRETPAAGTTRVRHAAGSWSLDGFLELDGQLTADHPRRYVSAFTVLPFLDNSHGPGLETAFHGRDASLGRVRGSFFRSGGKLMCTGQSEDGRYVLSQCLERIGKDDYLCRTVVLDGGRRVASWALHLEREPQAMI